MTFATVEIRQKGNMRAFLEKLEASLGGPRRVKVGFPAGTSDGIIKKAVFNEFGTVNREGNVHVPERPFMRITMQENREAYKDLIEKLSQQIVTNRMNMRQALGLLGEQAKGDIQKTISSSVPPPNAPSTIEKKGSSTTLIDTGEMRQHVTWQVIEGFSWFRLNDPE